MRASADRSENERVYVLFRAEDKVCFGPTKRRRLDQLQSFQTGVTLRADDDVVLDRNTDRLRDLTITRVIPMSAHDGVGSPAPRERAR